MKVTVSVPGKVFLMGEHAVVYGAPAIVASINKRLTVTLESAPTLIIESAEGSDYVRHCIDLVCQHFSIPIPAVHVRIVSDIPIGYHLGSSAAVAAGVVGAVIYASKKIWNPQLCNQIAYECEKMIHGNPSGADPAAVISGGLIWYRKELEFLRSIWQLPIEIPKAVNHFYLLDTGRPIETTGDMVAMVRRRSVAQPSRFEKIIHENELQTKQIALALKSGDEGVLIQAIQKGERTLEQMGVVSPKAKQYIKSIENLGGAAKILGGGGKKSGVGYILCYIPPAILSRVTVPLESIILGAPGITLHKDNL